MSGGASTDFNLYLSYLHLNLPRMVWSASQSLWVLQRPWLRSYPTHFLSVLLYSSVSSQGKKRWVAILIILPFGFFSKSVKDANSLICRNSIATIDFILIYYRSITLKSAFASLSWVEFLRFIQLLINTLCRWKRNKTYCEYHWKSQNSGF